MPLTHIDMDTVARYEALAFCALREQTGLNRKKIGFELQEVLRIELKSVYRLIIARTYANRLPPGCEKLLRVLYSTTSE